MSVHGMEQNNTVALDAYDHAITLVDSTQPPTHIESPTSAEDPSRSASVTEANGNQQITRQRTGRHLRRELARRKYAKWQQAEEHDGGSAEDNSEESGPDSGLKKLAKSATARSGRLRDKILPRTRKKISTHLTDHETFIDVLYENQRGWWLFGVPLYSTNSLLHIDPSGWQTSTFHDSPVNITNAQVPDPSWQWEWKTWYVDMSYDVDEEGWQYSFSFGKQFAWHGNHPWFHSFVRRRRWLRKRVKKHLHRTKGADGGMKAGHSLNPDYFTIHPAGGNQSRDTSADRGTTQHSSFTGAYQASSDLEEEILDIEDIAALHTALKRSIVDREKIAAVKRFITHGADELFYLAEAMPSIVQDFVHQTSARQLQQTLLHALEDAIKSRDQDEANDESQKTNSRRVENLVKAIRAGGVHANDEAYWSNLQSQVASTEAGPTNETDALDSSQIADISTELPDVPKAGEDGQSVRADIRGLSDHSQIFEEPHVGAGSAEGDDDQFDPSSRASEKGKGKA